MKAIITYQAYLPDRIETIEVDFPIKFIKSRFFFKDVEGVSPSIASDDIISIDVKP